MPWLRVPRRRDGRCATSRGFLAITASVSLRRSPSKLATASVPRGAHEISRPAPRPRARGSGVREKFRFCSEALFQKSGSKSGSFRIVMFGYNI